ncbi:hypothetical protein J1605_005478 [Eschrichtius robustus]|uniref:Uncharacterized protein n=1 Tax=Eschrichtius robustus TaxID=9764 RepID=A0AB34HC22_ESCRO|nr:hypothetical protein J1605_005478 [Eschrichtius robustus]
MMAIKPRELERGKEGFIYRFQREHGPANALILDLKPLQFAKHSSLMEDLENFKTKMRSTVSVREGQGVVLLCGLPPHSGGATCPGSHPSRDCLHLVTEQGEDIRGQPSLRNTGHF